MFRTFSKVNRSKKTQSPDRFPTDKQDCGEDDQDGFDDFVSSLKQFQVDQSERAQPVLQEIYEDNQMAELMNLF